MKCAVHNCSNSNDGKASSSSFFRFPTNASLLKHWLNFCGRDRKFNPKTSYICMEHFKTDDFENNMKFEMGFAKKRLLKHGAIPTINTASSNLESDTRTQQIKRTKKRKTQDIVAFLLEEHSYALKSIDEKNILKKSCQLQETKEPFRIKIDEDHMESLRTEIETLRKENQALKNVQKIQAAELKAIKEQISKIQGHYYYAFY